MSVGAGRVTHRQTYPLNAPAAASTGTRDKSGFTLEGKSNKESPFSDTATGYRKPQFTNHIHSCHRRSWTYNWTQWPIDRRPPTHPHDSLLTTAHPRTSRAMGQPEREYIVSFLLWSFPPQTNGFRQFLVWSEPLAFNSHLQAWCQNMTWPAVCSNRRALAPQSTAVIAYWKGPTFINPERRSARPHKCHVTPFWLCTWGCTAVFL